MLNNLFCHLHVHNEYSFLDGFGKSEDYAKRVKELDFQYVALTNHGNVDGLIEFQRECEKQGIKPIFGCEAYIVPDAKVKEKGEKRGHITLLVKNQQGWTNLCKMLTYANLEGFYYKPRIDYDTLLSHLEGLVILTGCSASFLKSEEGQNFFWRLYEKKKGDDVYLEVMPHDIEVQREMNNICLDFAQDNVPFIATNDCHYIYEDEWEVQEVLLAIQTKAKWEDKDRFKFGFKGLHLKTADEMIEAFEKQDVLSRSQYLGAMRNTVKVAKECCDFRIEKQDIFLPDVPGFGNKDESLFLRDLAEKELKKLDGIVVSDYVRRLHEEFDLIQSKGFVKYFLIVYELMRWAKENDIMTGPGRGSIGGSLVAYLLGITTVDPIKYDLLFSRFISEDRINFPDIDLDFADIKRHFIKEHLAELYGEKNIAGISTFLKMKGRAAIRDVARVFDIPYREVDEFAKSMDDVGKGKQKETLIKDAVVETSEGREFKRHHPKAIEFAIKLEGQIRGVGQHAAATVISADDLTQGRRGNLCVRNNTTVINWGMNDAEYVGLMKLDILGLNTLSILHETKKLVEQSHGVDIDFTEIPLDDEKVLEEFSKGNNVGIFQLNSHGLIQLCKDMEIDSFESIAQVTSLYRPGPLRSGMIDLFLKNKQRGEWESIHPKVEEITASTYGIIIYQEQVMQIVNRLAGMSYEKADWVRKVIGKSEGAEKLHKFKDEFVKGCVETSGLKKEVASKLWSDLEAFGGYGFNRSHAVEYSMISFWTMWCKVYYPTEFICASLTCGSENKKEELVKEAARLGLSLVAPKVGISDAKKWIAKEKKLYVPFIEIKGVGEKTAEKAASLCLHKKTNSIKGFFDVARPGHQPQTKLERTLEEIRAFDPEAVPGEGSAQYFSFPVSSDYNVLYPKLYDLFDDLGSYDIEEILQGRVVVLNLIQRKRFVSRAISDCERCDLIKECRGPVYASSGLSNVVICGEAPGPDEDEEGRPFVGVAGDLLWDELAKYGLKRMYFHVTNCCKCYPSRTRTPKREHVDACWPWLERELEVLETRLILAFGNTCLKVFADRDKGITEWSGKTEWNEKAGAWICWCTHPAAVKHNADNKESFEDGIRNFVEIYERFRKSCGNNTR